MRADYDSEGDTIQIELERVAAERYELDAEALIAAAQATLAAPDRAITLDVAVRAAA